MTNPGPCINAPECRELGHRKLGNNMEPCLLERIKVRGESRRTVGLVWRQPNTQRKRKC